MAGLKLELQDKRNQLSNLPEVSSMENHFLIEAELEPKPRSR